MTSHSPNARTSYVFGPVPSRRLGRSLGVDLVPYKVCSFDCVYCQVGRTTDKTIQRRRFMPEADVLTDVVEKLRNVPRPDYITLSGSGEPTLHKGLREIIEGIKRVTDVPVAVLTNGSLLFDNTVRDACAKADLVMPSLDAGDETVFQKINRPAAGLTLDKIVEGMVAFRSEFRGPIWLEVFLIGGINSDAEHVEKIYTLAGRVRPEKIQLNTAVRPTSEAGIAPLSEAALAEIAGRLGPTAEVIADFRHVHEEAAFAAKGEEILDMIRRRPVTLKDIAAGLGIHPNEASKYVEELLSKKLIRKERRAERDYLCAV